MSWPLVALKDCCTVVGGATPKREVESYWDSQDIPWVTPKDISKIKSIYLDDAPEYISQKGFDSCAAHKLPEGSLLLTSRAPIGNVAITTRELCTNQGFKSLVPSESVDIKYLYFCMLYSAERLENEGNGATFKEVSKKVVEAFKIPLPPLETQKKIAAVLEKADQLRQDCKLLEQELNSLAQSVFIDMFGSKASGYSEWPLHRIEELAESKKGSMRTGPFGSDLKHSEFVDEGIAVIGIDNAVKNEFAWGERRFITPEKYEKLKRYRVYPQDLIITIMGTTGRIAVIPDDIPLSISTKHLAVITLDKDKVIPEFLATAIKTHPDLLHQIIDSNKGAIMDGLNLGLIKALSLRLPPLDLQLKYLAVLKVIRERIFESRSSHEQNNDLFNALMQKAFKGELTL
ncbi:TPA: restriction endonuclease subunit S [Vibrio vulnificus]|uniref:restriction endonuclease subunit S n=1 Tax=Vibrio vulnificus TaxID=672 RepID=UPI0002FF7DFB|nr:restriction endonuclease subunit S [Vibrio vulnificus]HAS6938086.1 restriction endonuclease subunit S [Vibrio vulnificus]